MSSFVYATEPRSVRCIAVRCGSAAMPRFSSAPASVPAKLHVAKKNRGAFLRRGGCFDQRRKPSFWISAL